MNFSTLYGSAVAHFYTANKLKESKIYMVVLVML